MGTIGQRGVIQTCAKLSCLLATVRFVPGAANRFKHKDTMAQRRTSLSFQKLCVSGPLWLSLIALLGGGIISSRAAEALSPQAPSASAWQTKVQHIEGPDVVPSTWVYVTAQTNRFAIYVPEGFRFEPSQSIEKVILVSRDLFKVVTFQIVEPPTGDTNSLDSATYRDLLASRYAGATIQEEDRMNLDGRFGPCFDVRWRGTGGVVQRGRFVFFSTQSGVLEFSVTGRPEKMGGSREDLLSVLGLFRLSGTDGQVHLPQLSNKF